MKQVLKARLNSVRGFAGRLSLPTYVLVLFCASLGLLLLGSWGARARGGWRGEGGGARLAFHVQVSNATLPLLPRLLARLWDPGNLYLVHVDPAAGAGRRAAALRAAADLLERPNVHLMPPEPVTYQGVTLVLNTLNAMQQLLALGPWDYFLNLSGADYPLLTAAELRALVATLVPRQRLFLAFSPRPAWDWKLQARLGRIHADPGLSPLAPPPHAPPPRLVRTSATNPAARRLNGTVAAGDAWMLVPRHFCAHATAAPAARRLLALAATMSDPIEHFFQTLAWTSPRWRPRVTPHGMRHVVWRFRGRPAGQHPYVLDAPDPNPPPAAAAAAAPYPFWPALRASPYFFARKFSAPDSPVMDLVDAQLAGAGPAVDADLVRTARARRKAVFECLMGSSLEHRRPCGMDPNKFEER